MPDNKLSNIAPIALASGTKTAWDSARGRGESNPDTDWYASFIKQGVPEPAAATAAKYIAGGMDPAIALHVTYGLGLDKAPVSAWDQYAQAHPILSNTKKLLVTGGRKLEDTVKGKQLEHEKLSAATMLKAYLQHQDMQRAEESKKLMTQQMVHDAQVQDQFYTDNFRPPMSLSDFALAGMNYRSPLATPEAAFASPQRTVLPGELSKSTTTMGPRGR